MDKDSKEKVGVEGWINLKAMSGYMNEKDLRRLAEKWSGCGIELIRISEKVFVGIFELD